MLVENCKREDPFSVHTYKLSLYVPTEEINVTQMATIPVNDGKHCGTEFSPGLYGVAPRYTLKKFDTCHYALKSPIALI